MSVFLGHLVYGLGVVLFSLILSAGVGSMLSGVMASALAVVANIALRLNWTMILGGLCYGLLFFPSYAFFRLQK